jgi:hypothetical protein
VLAYAEVIAVPLWAIVAAGVAVVGGIAMAVYLFSPPRRPPFA